MAEPFASKTTGARSAEEDGVPQPIHDRIAALESDLAFHLERQEQKNQQIIDLVGAQKVRARRIAALKAELVGLQYAVQVLAMMPARVERAEQPEIVNLSDFVGEIGDDTEDTRQAPFTPPPAQTEDWGAASESEDRGVEWNLQNRDPLRFFPTIDSRKEALRRAMEKWSDHPETLPFTSSRIAGDTGLGSALETALTEGVAYGWLSKEGEDSYRWIDRPQQPAVEVPAESDPLIVASEDGVPPASLTEDAPSVAANDPIPPAHPVEILYQAIVRHAGQPAKIIRERAGLPDNYNSLFGVLNRTKRVRRDTAGNWFPNDEQQQEISH